MRVATVTDAKGIATDEISTVRATVRTAMRDLAKHSGPLGSADFRTKNQPSVGLHQEYVHVNIFYALNLIWLFETEWSASLKVGALRSPAKCVQTKHGKEILSLRTRNSAILSAMPSASKSSGGEFGRNISYGSLFLSKFDDIDREPRLLPYAHYLRQAWTELNLTGVLCVDGKPIVYICEAKRFSIEQKRKQLRFVWNQGLVPLLILLTPSSVEVHTGVRKPLNFEVPDEFPDPTLIPGLDRITEALECAKFVRSVETGQFFHTRADFFPPDESVDRCLVRNLIYAAKRLKAKGWKLERAHALLGRTLFVSFLQQRKFIKPDQFPAGTTSLLEIVKGRSFEESKRLLYDKGGLFPTLQREFNGTMFDAALAEEARDIRKPHLEILADFLGGAEMDSGQLTAFFDYDFRVIPVETISAIYEEFMKDADLKRKHQEGAFYTPRHLAETTLHIAVEDRYKEAADWCVLDPACGSGIFLVAMFNLLSAQWLRDNVGTKKKTKAQALLDILQQQIRGVDINLDACRIAAFSLYLALFEKLQPIDLDEFKEKVRADHFLPPLLASQQDESNAALAVITHGDFLEDSIPVNKKNHLIIGNPPWDSRGNKQIALHFARRSERFLREGGIGCLILPTTILVNRHGTLDLEWFRTVSVEKIVQLADYRKLMFAGAIHAGFIVRFEKKKPELDHVVSYETPKVSRFDRRRGIIVVEPDDQKFVRQRDIVEAGLGDKKGQSTRLQTLWTRKFWGSPRDEEFLKRLDLYPSLSESIQNKQCSQGVGFQPYYPGISPGDPKPLRPWKLTDYYLPNSGKFPQLVLRTADFISLKEGLAESVHPDGQIQASMTGMRRKPEERIFTPPMVIFSNGFTKFAFCRNRVLFQDSLRSISGSDEEMLLFLTAVLGSRLMQFHAFHSGSSNGIGRDKLHLYESLNLPFPLIDDDLAVPDAAEIVKEAAAIMGGVEKGVAGATDDERLGFVEIAKKKLEPLVESYFSVNDDERILIDDTLDLWQPSVHKTNVDLEIPTLRFPSRSDRKLYAKTLCAELNSFSRRHRIQPSVEVKVSESLNLICLTVIFGKNSSSFHEVPGDDSFWNALASIDRAAAQENEIISYLRGFSYFESDRIHILKPATMRNWCRTAALNDADAIFEQLSARPA